MLGYLYFEDNKNKVPTIPADTIKASLSMGMIVGQIGFGLFGDAIGRHRIYGKELMVTIAGMPRPIYRAWLWPKGPLTCS
jgi:MFS transporter, PHS family, inorganic phosphate transporter